MAVMSNDELRRLAELLRRYALQYCSAGSSQQEEYLELAKWIAMIREKETG